MENDLSITSFSELSAYLDELLAQYRSIKTYLEFCRSLRDSLGTETARHDDDPLADPELPDISQQLEPTLGDLSIIEESKEQQYESLAASLALKVQEELKKIDQLTSEFDDLIIQLNADKFVARQFDFAALEVEYQEIELRLSQAAEEQHELTCWQQLEAVLERRLLTAQQVLTALERDFEGLAAQRAQVQQLQSQQVRADEEQLAIRERMLRLWHN